MHDILGKLAGNTHFTTLDLVDAFHQCPLDEESRKYTAFITNSGCFEYNTMPMGLATSPNHYQFVVETILSGRVDRVHRHKTKQEGAVDSLLGKCWYIYIDDVLVFSRGTLKQHLDDLNRVICR